ncbi:hypothetical protein LQZ18_07030 [Lachnospiraceae bacterium ZAX-1]
MSWNPKYVLLLVLATFVTYLAGLGIEYVSRMVDVKKRNILCKLILIMGFVINLGILFFFKYYQLFVDSMNRFIVFVGKAGEVKMQLTSFDIALPVGISFYIFQALGYMVDVYRREIKAEKSLLRYALFISFFPQLVAGSIVRSKDMLYQIYEKHTFEYDRVKSGLL